jgi:hypothetical protein
MCFECVDAVAARIVMKLAADAGGRNAGRLSADAQGGRPAAKWKGEKTGDRSRR